MKLITRQTIANECADSWKRQYGHRNQEIYDELKALGSTPDPDQVDEVIGSKSWTRTYCDECHSENIPVVEVGEEFSYESSTANICRACLLLALEMTE